MVAAQELAHNLGLGHAPGCGAGGVDSGYPQPNGELDVSGVDYFGGTVHRPDISFDIMGYCGGEGNTWVSRYTYLNLLSRMRGEGSAAGAHLARSLVLRLPQAQQEYLVVGGVAYPVGIDIVTGPYRVAMVQPDAMPPGPYTVELLDGAGNVLAQRTFRPTPFSKGEHDSDTGSFFLTLPVIEEARTIRFLYQGREIGRLAASPGAPTVEILEPQGDAGWGSQGVHTIRWRARDPDGDPLRFTVQASEDGERWFTLALDLKDRDSFDVSVADLAGGSYYLRVLATDGFHSAEARTAGRVTVGRKPPKVSITSPADGDAFGVGQEAVLQAIAADLEDGELPDSAYRWTSSVDGELGTGPTLWALPLSPRDTSSPSGSPTATGCTRKRRSASPSRASRR